jgi:asparagine synthetase B (glutamine-hydrolysing)
LPETANIEQRLFPDGVSRYLWAKGYFFDSDGRMHYGSEIVDWLACALPGTNLRALLPGMNGCFSILVANPQSRVVELGSDRLATVPVFVHATDSSLIVSDDYWNIVHTMETPRYDHLGLTGMLLMSHTLGPRTMIDTIQTFPPAAVQTFVVGDRIRRSQETYWTNEYRPRSVSDYNKLRQKAAVMLVRVFDRYNRAVQERDWTVTVPLSGGLDSRLAAGLMHAGGAQVRALSYGPSGYAEPATAEQVSDALSIPFSLTSIDDPALMSPEVIEL